MRAPHLPVNVPSPHHQADVFPPRRDYSSLSLKDLLDARDAYHVYLSSMENVVATEKDWYATHPPDQPRPAKVPLIKEAKTLANTVIRPWSWPAVLVFVKKWATVKSLGSEAVPRTLYLPDGRVVPTCVIETVPDESLPSPATGPFNTSPLLGGGYACLRDHQGIQSLGTISCLVKKQGSYFALTNRHVAGGNGEEVRAYIEGQYQRFGKTANMAVDRQVMSNVYPRWPGSNVLLTLDAGLIRVDDINNWTAQVFGIGEIGELFDATDYSITLDLIGCPLRAFGATSAISEGQICALFFRYESLNGYEYVTELLIGPRPGATEVKRPITRPGDSGALWFYDPPAQPAPQASHDFDNIHAQTEQGEGAPRLRPVVMQWGGQRIVLSDGSQSSYALGTFLSTICRALDVEVIRDWSLGYDETWGKIGHFSIGWKACDYVGGNLKKLMQANQANIGFSDDDVSKGSNFTVNRDEFVPLADVPDYLWVVARGTHPNEAIQHFADIDIVDINGGKSLLQQCVDDPQKVAASTWKAYFDGFAAQGLGPEEGALPFRVWQLWKAMVEYLQDGDLLRFVAAGGVMAHYVGDASQPLHCSYMHHGIPPMKTYKGREYPVPRDSDAFQTFKTTREAQIHSIYEETMLEVDTATLLAGVDNSLSSMSYSGSAIDSGHAAGVAVIELMQRSQGRLTPLDIIQADDPSLGAKARAKQLWSKKTIRDATIESLADSVLTLAALWMAAWKEGKGNTIAKTKLAELDQGDLDDLVRKDRSFVPSLSLDEMAHSGDFEP
jgi:hypothetical protein